MDKKESYGQKVYRFDGGGRNFEVSHNQGAFWRPPALPPAEYPKKPEPKRYGPELKDPYYASFADADRAIAERDRRAELVLGQKRKLSKNTKIKK